MWIYSCCDSDVGAGGIVGDSMMMVIMVAVVMLVYILVDVF